MSENLTLVSAMARLRRGPGRGFTFVGRDREERFFAYEALESEAWRRAAFLQERGLKKGDRAALVIAEPEDFVLSFLGCAVAGVVPVPVYPRASFKNAGTQPFTFKSTAYSTSDLFGSPASGVTRQKPTLSSTSLCLS